jgi:hypothetical protein
MGALEFWCPQHSTLNTAQAPILFSGDPQLGHQNILVRVKPCPEASLNYFSKLLTVMCSNKNTITLGTELAFQNIERTPSP